MQNFPQRLADAIRRSGKRKGALAEHCGVALSTVSRWLGGSEPSAEHVTEIAGFLGVDAKWLMFGDTFGSEIRPSLVLRDEPLSYSAAAAPALTLEQRVERLESLLLLVADQHAETVDMIRRYLTKR